MSRTQLYADPANRFVHDLILESCRRNPGRTAIVDSSNSRRISYAEYGEIVEVLARGLVGAGVKPGEIVAIFLQNSWEFCAAYHAVTLAGAIPTLLNPTYRDREVSYQLEDSGAVLLISDGPQLEGINFAALPNLRGIYTTRQHSPGTLPLSDLLRPSNASLPKPRRPFERNSRRASILQRHHWSAQGSHAQPPQLDCQHISVDWPGCLYPYA